MMTMMVIKSPRQKSQSQRNQRKTLIVKVSCPKERHEFTVEGKEGDTIYNLIEQETELAEYLECACGGEMMCSTCHVYVDQECYDQMLPPIEAEEDMLDLAYEYRSNSRLGCQLKLDSKYPQPLRITIPEGSNNYFN